MPAPALPDASRRAFLRGRPRSQTTIRPPWALPEARFLDTCTRCTECVRACPERILKLGDGGFPTVDFSQGDCTFCEECVAVCEPRALDFHVDRAPWNWVASIAESCLAQQGIVCESFRDACPEQAIRFPRLGAVPRPLLEPSRCTGCGACLRVCPPQAIALTDAGQAPA